MYYISNKFILPFLMPFLPVIPLWNLQDLIHSNIPLSNERNLSTFTRIFSMTGEDVERDIGNFAVIYFLQTEYILQCMSYVNSINRIIITETAYFIYPRINAVKWKKIVKLLLINSFHHENFPIF